MSPGDILNKKIEATKNCIEYETDLLALAVSDRQWEEVQKSVFHIEKLNFLLIHLNSIKNLMAEKS